MSVSILILTLNEEDNLPRCLESVKWSDDVVVYDSFSTDATVELARAAGASVVQRKFDNWAAHQNWGVANIAFKHEWVFYIDADEVMTQELRDELIALSKRKDLKEVAFRVRRKDMFFGQWLKRSSMYPIWIVRYFKPAHMRYERLVNPVAVVDGPEGNLQGHMIHYSFNKGIRHWITKHNQYARLEADESLKSLNQGILDLPGLFSRDFVRRRRAMKLLSFRLPFRPTLRFAYMYFLRRGFLDGWAGLTYCRLVSIYEYLIVLNMKEVIRRQKDEPI